MPIPWAETPDRPPLSLGAPAERAVLAASYNTVEKLIAASEADLLRLHGVGPRAIQRIREARAQGPIPT